MIRCQHCQQPIHESTSTVFSDWTHAGCEPYGPYIQCRPIPGYPNTFASPE